MPILEAYSFSSQHRRMTLKRVPHHTRMEVTPMSTNRIRQICTGRQHGVHEHEHGGGDEADPCQRAHAELVGHDAGGQGSRSWAAMP